MLTRWNAAGSAAWMETTRMMSFGLGVAMGCCVIHGVVGGCMAVFHPDTGGRIINLACGVCGCLGAWAVWCVLP
jgi:hypothetical protein